jgi:hypothetical protein
MNKRASANALWSPLVTLQSRSEMSPSFSASLLFPRLELRVVVGAQKSRQHSNHHGLYDPTDVAPQQGPCRFRVYVIGQMCAHPPLT